MHGVSAPALVVMGERDPDFPSPAEEAAWIADRLRGRVLMVADAGHYPPSQRPDVVAPEVVEFLRTVATRAQGGAVTHGPGRGSSRRPRR